MVFTIITHAIEFIVYALVLSCVYIIGFRVTPTIEKQNVVLNIIGSLTLYFITIAVMVSALACFLIFIHRDVDENTFLVSIALWAISALSVNIARHIILTENKNNREVVAKIIAPILAFFVLFTFLLGVIAVYSSEYLGSGDKELTALPFM